MDPADSQMATDGERGQSAVYTLVLKNRRDQKGIEGREPSQDAGRADGSGQQIWDQGARRT